MNHPEFDALVLAVSEYRILSLRVDNSQNPPAFYAHLMLDGGEYLVSALPTDLERPERTPATTTEAFDSRGFTKGGPTGG